MGDKNITLKDFQSNFLGFCPSSHRYAFLNGQYCCRTNKENVIGTPTDSCDGSLISIDSSCCENDDYKECPFGTCKGKITKKSNHKKF